LAGEERLHVLYPPQEAEGPMSGRRRAGGYQDRNCQSCQQSLPLCLAPGANRACVIEKAVENTAEENRHPASFPGVRNNDCCRALIPQNWIVFG
jgi:hypothetical protein